MNLNRVVFCPVFLVKAGWIMYSFFVCVYYKKGEVCLCMFVNLSVFCYCFYDWLGVLGVKVGMVHRYCVGG